MTDSTKNELKWNSFFGAIDHMWFDYLEDKLQEYDIGYYIIAAEVAEGKHKKTNGQHFHIVAQMAEKDYNAYVKRVFKDKFKLSGRAGNGEGRQYGRVKDIENIVKMKAYVLKDGNFRTNVPEDEIKELLTIAFKKDEKETEQREFRDRLMASVHQDLTSKQGLQFHEITKRDVGIAIIAEFQRLGECAYPLSSMRLGGYIKHYTMYIMKMPAHVIYDNIYN